MWIKFHSVISILWPTHFEWSYGVWKVSIEKYHRLLTGDIVVADLIFNDELELSNVYTIYENVYMFVYIVVLFSSI